MSEDIITVKILKDFLDKIPEKYNDYELINGEVLAVPNNEGEETFFIMANKPIIQMQIDEDSKTFCMLYQSEEDLENILNQMEDNGNTKGTE